MLRSRPPVCPSISWGRSLISKPQLVHTLTPILLRLPPHRPVDPDMITTLLSSLLFLATTMNVGATSRDVYHSYSEAGPSFSLAAVQSTSFCASIEHM
jgi:hypothetical protein